MKLSSIHSHRKNIFRAVAAVATVLFAIFIFAAPQPAHASWFGAATASALADVASNFVGWVAYIVSYVISFIVGIFIAIVIYVIGIILQLNGNVMNTLAVKSGFQVTLALTNLGFVLGIIVIALATILRRETYGIKQLLWKLLVAAILVNFSLVIGGVIINFSNQLTMAFLTPYPGGGGGFAAFHNFSQSLAGAFAPHRIFLTGYTQEAEKIVNNQSGAAFGGSLSTLLTSLFSIVFTVVMLTVILITLVAILVMLLIRYIYLTLLLILMPLAWLTWVFPNLSHHFSKWWSEFIRWCFFAPAMMFFLYLAIATAGLMNNANSQGAAATDPAAGLQGLGYQPGSAGFLGDISGIIGGALNGLTGQLLQMLVIVGLAVGGMIAANSLGIKGADMALKTAGRLKDATLGYVGKQSKKGVRAGYRALGGETLTKNLQTGNLGRLGRIPGIGGVFRRGASYAGQGLSRVDKAGSEHLVEHEAKWASEFAKNPKEAAHLLAGSLPPEKQIALLKALAQSQDLDQVKTVNGVAFEDFLARNKKLIAEDYGEAKFYDKDLRKSTGNGQVINSARAVAAGDPDRMVSDEDGKLVKASDSLRTSMKAFSEGLKTGDASKIDFNYLFDPEKMKDGAHKVQMDMFLRTLASTNYQMIPVAMRQMKGKSQKEFKKLYEKSLNEEEKYQNDLTPTTDDGREEKKVAVENLKRAQDALPKLLQNLASYAGGGGTSGATSAPAAPASP